MSRAVAVVAARLPMRAAVLPVSLLFGEDACARA